MALDGVRRAVALTVEADGFAGKVTGSKYKLQIIR